MTPGGGKPYADDTPSLADHVERIDRGLSNVHGGLKGLADVVLRNEDSIAQVQGDVENLNLRLREFEDD